MMGIVQYIGIAGFIVCLIIMHTTDFGIKGLRKYDAGFRLLDMRFHYTADDVGEVFEKLGKAGREVYRNYWILDFFFIACFLIVMLAIVNKVVIDNWARNLLIVLAVSRAVFDIVENSILMYLSNIFPVRNDSLAAICSWVTTCKFIVLYAWILGILAMTLYSVINGKIGN
jgi:hypothetical protein